MIKEVLTAKNEDIYIKVIREGRNDIYINVSDIANPGWVINDVTSNGYRERIQFSYYTKSNEGFSISSDFVSKGDSSLESTKADYADLRDLVLELMFEGNPVAQQFIDDIDGVIIETAICTLYNLEYKPLSIKLKSVFNKLKARTTDKE